MNKKPRTLLVLLLQITLLFLYGCGAPREDKESPAEVVIQGNTQDKEVIQTLVINNCDGKSDLSRTEERTQSVDVTISAEIAATIGVSAEIISAEVQTVVSAATTQGGSRSMAIALTAPPQTHMQFQLIWIGNEQIGVVQNLRGSHVPIAFQGFMPTDVRIESQKDRGCLTDLIPTSDPTQIPEPHPTSTIQPDSPSVVAPTNESSPSVSNLPYLVIVVGCTDTTAFSCDIAQDYNHNNGTYFEVSTALEAENLLLQQYQEYDTVYAVHVPNLKVTPDDSGACWLHVNQVDLLEIYSKGWVVGENVILADQIAKLEPCFLSIPATTQPSESNLIVFGYTASDLAVQQAIANCTSCSVIYLSSLEDISDDWKHYTHNIATASANLSDGCRTKQELVELNVTFMIANNYTPCP